MTENFEYFREEIRARVILSSLRPVPVPWDSAKHITARLGREFKSTKAGLLCVMMIKEELSCGAEIAQEPTATPEIILDA